MGTKNLRNSILIIEDEQAALNVLTETFVAAKFNVLQATDGETGLAIALKEHPDMILLDLIIPKMDGIEVLKKLRADRWGKTASVIILSNLSSVEKIGEPIPSQLCDFVIKTNIKLKDLVKKVKKKLHR